MFPNGYTELLDIKDIKKCRATILEIDQRLKITPETQIRTLVQRELPTSVLFTSV